MPTAHTALQLCADFALFPDDTQLGPSFSLAGFDFEHAAALKPMFVNVTANERGLQFPKEGVEITLPVPATTVKLRLGAFSGPVDIIALDSAGTTVRQQTIQIPNQYMNIRIAAPEIATLVLANGNNEGILVSICVALCTC